MDLLSCIDARSVRLAHRIALIAVAGILCIAGLTAVDVALRGLANSPIYGFVEAAELIMTVTLKARVFHLAWGGKWGSWGLAGGLGARQKLG